LKESTAPAIGGVTRLHLVQDSLLTFTGMCCVASLIAVRVCHREAEVEVGGDCPTGLLHKPDVRDLQDIVIGRVPRRQVGGGTAAAIGPGSPVQVDALPVNPLALCMIWMPCIW